MTKAGKDADRLITAIIPPPNKRRQWTERTGEEMLTY